MLEVFWQITDWDLKHQASGHGISHVLHPMPDAVRDMHIASGLIDDIAHAATRRNLSVELSMIHLFRALAFTGPIPLAGSGVVFDQRIIRRQWPDIHKRLTYWTVDVSPIRRMAQGMGFGDLCLPDGPKAHRSEADVRRAQAEFAHWRFVLRDTVDAWRAS